MILNDKCVFIQNHKSYTLTCGQSIFLIVVVSHTYLMLFPQISNDPPFSHVQYQMVFPDTCIDPFITSCYLLLDVT